MRIAYVIVHANRREGSARPVAEVGERLAWAGHEIHLYARTCEDIDRSLVHWHRIPGPGWPSVVDFSTFHVFNTWARLRQHYDIVHTIGCNVPSADVITIQNIQPAKMKFLAGLSGTDQVSLGRQFTRWLYLQTTCLAEHWLYTHRPGCKPPLFLPVSRGVEAELRRHYDIGPAPVRIIPNAADVVRFAPLSEPARQRWRAANGLVADDVVLIFSGGEWARKGLDLALQTLPLLPDSKVKLFVAGDDPNRVRFQQLARDAGVMERVIFGGFRRDIAEALAASDIFLFPSRYEAFSLAMLEAAACGLPVIATSINGTEDFIQPGVTGEFTQHDPADIARVLRPLTESKAVRTTMGKAARQLVEQRYTWDEVARATETAYEACLQSKRKPG